MIWVAEPGLPRPDERGGNYPKPDNGRYFLMSSLVVDHLGKPELIRETTGGILA
jgi:hypothetical protein